MTDREKITEILKAYTKKHNISASSVILEEYAEELVANGVMLPPCRCKDCTYLRESDVTNKMFCTYHGDYHEVETFLNDYCSNGIGMVKGV